MTKIVDRPSAFKRDYKRIKATPRYNKELDSLLSDVLKLLIADKPLPAIYRDHNLVGNWLEYRECHLKPDLLLIYKNSEDVLRLARLGSHSELFDK